MQVDTNELLAAEKRGQMEKAIRELGRGIKAFNLKLFKAEVAATLNEDSSFSEMATILDSQR